MYGCNSCEAVCKLGALKVYSKEKEKGSNNSIYYEIDENKCTGCLECMKYFKNECYINKILRIKKMTKSKVYNF